ncbi:MAG TPA: hypothetical protein PKD53_28855 [Chloroflexaceae bacterium]|nr:hypothetical protein [Chloroflexaceae bacterium]
MRRVFKHRYVAWGPARRAVGYFCLFVWALGAILPIIPGWPALIVAIALLGRRDRTLRLLHLLGRRTLRWLRRHPAPQVRPMGLWLSERYVALRRAITPGIIAAERALGT